MQSEADFLNSLLSSMDASHTSQVTSSLPAPPSTSTLPSQPIQASTSRNTQQSTKEVEQLLEGAEDWDWNDDDLEDGNDVGMPDASDAVMRMPERIIKPDMKERFTPSAYTRCIVESVEMQTTPKRQKALVVRFDDKSKDRHRVFLRDDWTITEVSRGDIVNIIGAFTPSSRPYKSQIEITSQSNWIILHPDILLTATTIASSAPCIRKPLITNLLPSTSNETSQALVWGTMLHEIFQSCLAEGRWDDRFINAKTDQVVREGLGDLVKLNVSIDVAKTEIAKRAKGLQGFSKRFISTSPNSDAVLTDNRAKKGDETLLAICGLHDTEEDIWSPRFGLKGKLDASVQVILDGKDNSSDRKLSMPLEIKTGWRASMEHRAQTMLYTVLMEERYGAQVPSGLLYYTQNDEVIRVNAARAELRSLIQNRNRMVVYMMRRESASKSDSASACSFLPPTEDDERMCGKCFAVDGCMLYRKAVEGVVDETSEIASLYAAKTDHLTASQCEFFKKWEELISLEERDILRFRRELWTMGAEEREKTGRCFANMVMVDHETPAPVSAQRASIHRYTYTFARKGALAGAIQIKDKVAKGSSVLSILSLNKPKAISALSAKPLSSSNIKGSFSVASSTAPSPSVPSSSSLLSGQISKGDAVTVSIEPDFLSLTRGYVLSLDKEKITIGVDRELDVKQILGRKYGDDIPSQYAAHGNMSQVVFRIDRDELAAGIGRIRNNLAQLFYASGDTKRLQLVVDLKKPQFDPLPASLPPHPLLNADQNLAMHKVLSAQDYAVLLGMPGTGKTTTIAEIIKELVKRGKSVLLSSYTHSAVDTILMKLKDVDFEVLRLGNVDKIHPDVYKMSLAAKPTPTSVEQLEQQLLSPPVVATTCLSIDHTLFSRRHFDVCIVDEASQITLPTCLGPLRFADKFVLVGDHYQLPPLVRSPQARKGGLDVSLFRRLSEAHPDAVVQLGLQYRMNEDIMKVSNELIYDGRLKCGNPEVAQRSLGIKTEKALAAFHSGLMECAGPKKSCWLNDLLDPNRRVVFVDTDSVPSKETRVGDLVQNEVEANLVAQLTKALVRGGVEESQIGIISLYRQQVKLLSHLIEPHTKVETLTADRSQGRDKDCIIISMCRSNDTNSIGDLLKDWRRLNVSFTRARSKLVIFGSRSTLSSSALLSEFFELMERQSWIYKLPPGAHLSHESSGTGNRGVKRKRSETEDKENAIPDPVLRSSPRKKPRLETSKGKAKAGSNALLRGRGMLRDVVMELL